MATFLKYNTLFDKRVDPLAIEFVAIKNMGKWRNKRKEPCGKGLAYHVMEAVRLMWPDTYWHKWNEGLLFPEFCKPGRVAVYGPSSSGKSLVFSQFALTMFYARPKGTTVIISSTTLDALKSRIWHYVTDFDKKARKRYPWLPGHMIESSQKMLADPSTEDGRSFIDGIMGVALKKGGTWQGMADLVGRKNEVMIVGCDELSYCFPAGTLVDTPSGRVAIEKIKIGDEVFSAIGPSKVSATSKRFAHDIVSVKTKNGVSVSCTSGHKFFTQKGWIKACELNQSHFIVSTNESMRILRTGSSQEEKVLQQILRDEMETPKERALFQAWEQSKAIEEMRTLRKTEGARNEEVLQPKLSRHCASRHSGIRRKETEEISTINANGSCEKPRLGKTNFGNDGQEKSNGTSRNSEKSFGILEGDRSQASNSWRERNWSDTSRVGVDEVFPGSDKQLRNQDREIQWKRVSNLLQSGLRLPGNKTGSGSGRGISQQPNSSRPGCEKDNLSLGAWVDRVEVQEQKDSGGTGIGSGGVEVYNIAVEGHPSYSVNGLLVHNCPVSILDSLANLESNEMCFAAFMGNLPDVDNSLAKAAEPKGGWDSLADSERSRVYETKWYNGRAIQLIGTDSPNMDYPEGHEPYKNLIGRRYIEQCAHNYGRESDKFNMFAMGKIPRASMNRTVFTKSQCIKFNSMEPVIWGSTELVRGYGIDAAYSGVGGDRTVGFPFVFGKDNRSMWRLWFGRMLVFKGSDSPKMTHAEAIVHQCKVECDSAGIPPDHVFYDGTGRSELTIAFARLWSASVVPLEFGGPATDRPSFTGERHFHGEKLGDTKTCKEAFDRFVTELWFASAYCITCDQMRGMNEEAIEEGSQRKWEIVRGAKQCVETKDDMKERGLRSPDMWDSVVVCCEGARRLGFPLGKSGVAKKTSYKWLDSQREDNWKRMEEETLSV